MSRFANPLAMILVVLGTGAVAASSAAVQNPIPSKPMTRPVTHPAQAKAAGKVTAMHLTANPQRYTGPCPGRITFAGSVTTNGPAKVPYTLHSGMKFPNGKEKNWAGSLLTFNGTGTQNISKTITFTGDGSNFSSWMDIGTDKPNAIHSPQVNFSVACTGGASAGRQMTPAANQPRQANMPGAGGQGTSAAGGNVGGQGRHYANVSMSGVHPTEWRGACPHTFQFSAVIWSETAGDVHYTWVRSDGGQGKTETLHFPGNLKIKAYDNWSLSAPNGNHYRGWERLKIDSPNTFTGPEIIFNLYCSK